LSAILIPLGKDLATEGISGSGFFFLKPRLIFGSLNLLLLLVLLAVDALLSVVFLLGVLFAFRVSRSLAMDSLSFCLRFCFGIVGRI
jgi:hypothetical protein